MRPVCTFTVTPSLPRELEGLKDLAYNLRWCWNHDMINLFRRLDSDLWEETNHNPVKMLGSIKQERIEEAAADEGFKSSLGRMVDELDDYLGRKSWFDKKYPDGNGLRVAYFSAEFGISECVPIYSGGLGVLSGDHVKSASDLGLPFVGVGLLYQKGYFRQYLNADGWQQEQYPMNDFFTMPCKLVRRKDGAPVTATVDMPAGPVTVQVWQFLVGRTQVYLLDANIPANRFEDKMITHQLYGGDLEMRIRQELLLGIGGLRALAAMGIRPTVCHMNEGHSAFLAIERIREQMHEKGMSFDEARELVAAGNVFTTHTPVPAGNDVFPPELVDKYCRQYYDQLGIGQERFLGLGRQDALNQNEHFCMTVLAIRLSDFTNGVSKLHGVVSRRMWQGIWPDLPEQDIPISSITNGVHPRTWISEGMTSLFDRYLGPRWNEEPANGEIWGRVDQIPAEELWRTHERRRERLVAFARARLRKQLANRGALQAELQTADEVLDPEALTLGFARRFASYKRATLILKDTQRLLSILNDKDRPVQLIFAGKAHPHDDAGKSLIRHIIHIMRRSEFRHRIVFIEDYDMVVARYMVQGVDVWVNTPRRELEASGTSGMKVSMNGGLNLSILDGWWDEAYDHQTGWAIGRGELYDDLNYQDKVESDAIYDILEKEIVPAFYDRGPDGLPRRWINLMKSSMKEICPRFNTHRMVWEYTERFYQPASRRAAAMEQDNGRRARELAEWKQRLESRWSGIRIDKVVAEDQEFSVGEQVNIKARIFLGDIDPEMLRVQIYFGPLTADERINAEEPIDMHCSNRSGEGYCDFEGSIPCRTSGRHGFSIRALPAHPDLSTGFVPGMIHWSC